MDRIRCAVCILRGNDKTGQTRRRCQISRAMPVDFSLRKLALSSDGRLLFSTRSLRLFAYGFLSVVLMIYLARIGLTETQIVLLFTLTLIGDTIISLWITTAADSKGRRRMLIVGSLLMVFAGVLFAAT